jgi:hypothetical protein
LVSLLVLHRERVSGDDDEQMPSDRPAHPYDRADVARPGGALG